MIVSYEFVCCSVGVVMLVFGWVVVFVVCSGSSLHLICRIFELIWFVWF